MKKIKLKTLTIIFGVAVALSAVAIGTSYSRSLQLAEIETERPELPSMNFIDLNKVLYIFSHK